MRSFAVLVAVIITAVLSARLTAQGAGCGETQYPRRLPQPSALVDSAHAIADLAPFAGPKPMLFSLVFEKGDSVPRIRPLDQNDAAAAVALVNYVRRQPPGALWAIRVRIAGGDAPALTLERSQYCPPVPVSKDVPAGVVAGVIAQPRHAVTPLMGTVARPEALIGVDGRVLIARLIQSSGVPQVDYEFIRDLQGKRFRPARLDGEPIEAIWRPEGNSPRP
jgi:hypothetical protein